MAKRAADITPIRGRKPVNMRAPQKIKALTSSGQLVGRPGDPQVPPPGHATHLWQFDALNFSDGIPELKASSMWYGNCGSRVRLVPGLYDDYGSVMTSFDDTDVEPPPEMDEAAEYIHELQDRLGGQSEIMRAGYENFFLTGECFLVGYEGATGNDWEVLSVNELRAMGTGSKTLGQKFARMWGPGLPLEELPPDTFIGRLWWPHRRFKRLADSSVHACLEICLAEGTLISTDLGPVPIEQVEVGDVVWSWDDGDLVKRSVLRVMDQGTQPVFKVRTTGRSIRATAAHRFLRITRSGPGGKGYAWQYSREWVTVDELRRGDLVVSSEQLPDEGEAQYLSDGTEITEDVAWVLGVITGDGHVQRDGWGFQVAIFPEESQYGTEIYERLVRVMHDVFGLEPHARGAGGTSVQFNSARLADTLAAAGLKHYAYDKFVPPLLWRSSAKVQRAFLDGVEVTDGHRHNRGYMVHGLSSERLVRELRAMYIGLGYRVSNVHRSRMAGTRGRAGLNVLAKHDCWKFDVYDRTNRLGQVLDSRVGTDRWGNRRATPAEMAGTREWFAPVRVLAIEANGEAPTWDLEIEDTHNFIADGLVTHNCEELTLLTHGVRASQVSRLRGAGVWLIPTGSISGYGEGGEEGSEEDDPFLRDFMESMINPIEDPASSSRCVPLVVEMDGEDIARQHFVDFGAMDRTEQVVERREAIERLANGLNLAPSRVLGHADTTFSNAATIGEDEFRSYLEPTAILLCAGLTNTYLAERFRARLGIAPDAPLPPPYDRIAVGYDASKLIAKPDRSKEIMQALQVAPWIVSSAAARRAIGIEEADAPDDTEILETLHRHQQLNTRGTIRIAETDPTLSVAVDRVLLADPDGDLDQAKLDYDAEQEAAVSPPPPPPGEVPPVPGPPAVEPAAPVTASAMPASALFAVRASAAAELAVTLAVEAAGRRLRGKARGGAKSALDGVANDRVALTLGPAAVAKLSGDEEPFNGELAALGSMLARLAADAGMPDAARVAGHVVGLVDAAAAARLFDPSAVLSATMVEEALRG